MFRSLAFCLWLLPVVLAGNLAGANYYVSVDGRDSNSGSERAPLRHISKAAAVARHPGDTVIVLDGTYDNEGVVTTLESVRSVVMLEHSGASGMPITFRALHRGRAILDSGSTSSTGCNGAWAYFDLSYVSYVVIEGFVLENSCIHGIRVNGTAHDITIRWNAMQDIGNWNNTAGTGNTAGIPGGVYLNSSEYNITIDGNVFTNIGGGSNVNQQHAVYTSGTNVTIVNNIFYNNVHGWDIQTAGGVNVLIANNTFAFANPHREGQIILWDNDKPGSLANVTIRDNLFYEPLDVAVVTTLKGPIRGACTIDHNVATVRKMFDGGSPCSLRDNRTGVDAKLVRTSAPYDFHLLPGSPAIGAGAPIPELAHDHDGTARLPNSPTDAGAFAFIPRASGSGARP